MPSRHLFVFFRIHARKLLRLCLTLAVSLGLYIVEKKNTMRKGKPVQKFDLSNNQTVATYLSTTDAQKRTGVNQSVISNICCGNGKKTAGGFGWRFANAPDREAARKRLMKRFGREEEEGMVKDPSCLVRPTAPKPVESYDLESGDTIFAYPSATEAQRKTGIDHSHISNVCHDNSRSAGGYGWRFSDAAAVARSTLNMPLESMPNVAKKGRGRGSSSGYHQRSEYETDTDTSSGDSSEDEQMAKRYRRSGDAAQEEEEEEEDEESDEDEDEEQKGAFGEHR